MFQAVESYLHVLDPVASNAAFMAYHIYREQCKVEVQYCNKKKCITVQPHLE